MKSRSSDIFAQLFAFRKFLSMNFFQVIIDLFSSFSIVDLYYVFNEDHLYSIFEKSLHL